MTLGELYRWVFPLSLSFYCFQSMTYTIDLYRGTRPGTRSYLTHLTSASLFTVIVAGPINRISDLIKQLQQPFSLTSSQGGRAFLLISSGLIKKLLIADFLSNNVANRIFDTPTLYSGAEVLIGVYAYALQIYFDFSGYTDIAMGVCLLFGLTVPDNFNRPYQSLNIADFWSAGTLLSPTGCATTSTSPSLTPTRWKGAPYVYPIIVFLLGGLWHGIGWPFVLWGLLHGVGLTLLRTFQTLRQKLQGKRPATQWGRYVAIAFTFHFVCLTWIFFRSPDVATAFAILGRLGFHDLHGQQHLPPHDCRHAPRRRPPRHPAQMVRSEPLKFLAAPPSSYRERASPPSSFSLSSSPAADPPPSSTATSSHVYLSHQNDARGGHLRRHSPRRPLRHRQRQRPRSLVSPPHHRLPLG